MNKLNDIFDKIFVIHCVENEERYNNILFQKEQGDLDLDIWWTCYHPWSNQIINGLILTNRCRYIINGSEFNLTREFYTIIKTSYYKGYNRILIFEDDFCLMKKKYLNDFLNNIPNDFDIIQFSILANKDILPNANILNYEYNKGNYFIKCDRGYWSNCGLALSKKGMKYFIDTIDKEFLAADIPIFESQNSNPYYGKTNTGKGLNHYIPNIPLIYLDGKDSRVQTEDKEKLYKHYKLVDKKHYNIYNSTN